MNELAQNITNDRELTKNAYQYIKAQLDEEMAKPVKNRDYEKIASLSADLCALIDGEPETNEVDNGINKLYNRISEYEKNRRKPSVRVVRKMIPVVCVAAVMLVANCFTVSAFGKNVFSVVIEFAQGGFSIDFNKRNDVIELPTSEDDPYGIIAECAKYEIYPETPHYLPDGFELTLITNDVNEHSNYAKFVFKNEDKVIALTYTRYWNDVIQTGIPSDHYNITETTVNGYPAIISKEDNQFTLTYQVDKTVILIFTQDVDYAECEKIAASMK